MTDRIQSQIMIPQINDYDCQFRNLEKRTSFFNQIDRQISESLICSVCKEVFIDPIQVECGCRFCRSCISSDLSEDCVICPECHLEISRRSFHKDKAIEKEISKLPIKCINTDCPYTCKFRDLKQHLEICHYRQEKCERCQESYVFHSREKHLSKLCGKLIVKCEDCGSEMTKDDLILRHRNIEAGLDFLCQNLKGPCPYKCSNDTFENIRSHVMECSCRPIHCPLKDIGCDAMVTPMEITKHLQEYLSQHQIIMMNEIIRLSRDNDNLKQTMEEMKHIKTVNEELISEVKALKLKENESIRNLENVKREITQLNNKSDSSPVGTRNIVHVESGVCTWMIRDIKQKCLDARSGNQTQITSEPFYLSTPGYRMILKVYPNGDGRAKDKFLSVYFVIAKGEYDDFLVWPFDERVNMVIVSNNPSSPNLTVRMKPDRNELCYGKPVNEFNIGAGHPEFIQLSELLGNDHYVHEGSLYLKLSMRSLSHLNSYQNHRRNSSRI